MAGKADLVNSIVDSAPSYIQQIPERDGWKIPESYADGGFASTQSETPPEGGSVGVGTGGGGG